MDHHLPSVLQAITSQLAALSSEREQLMSRIREIDDRIAKVGRSLGLEPDQLASDASLPRLERPDARSIGTMSAQMLDMLLNAERGYTRVELRDALREFPKYRAQIDNNQNTFYNNVHRYLKSGKIVDIDGFLYHPARAPKDEAEAEEGGVVRLMPRERKFDL